MLDGCSGATLASRKAENRRGAIQRFSSDYSVASRCLPNKVPSVRLLTYPGKAFLGKGVSVNKDTIASPPDATPLANRAVRRSVDRLPCLPTRQASQPLGTYGKSSSEQAQPDINAAITTERIKDVLTRRYELRDQAGIIMTGEAVARCGRFLAPQSGGVDVLYSPTQGTSHYAGLEACHSVWMCPCCAAKISERRRLELAIALRLARRFHLKVVMITYTFSHHRGEILTEMLTSMSRAWGLYTSGRRSNKLYTTFGVVGFIKALEVTYSDDNGWHPHIHQLVLLPEHSNTAAFGSAARTLWEEAAYSAGLTMNEYGFKLDDCNEKVAWYIAKFNRDPSDVTLKAWEQGWTEANELTKWHTKLGRGADGQAEHVTPMQLLSYANAGDTRSAALFREYCVAFKGKRQLYWSPGLKAMFQIKERTDKELAEEQTADATKLAFLYLEEWLTVVKAHKRVDLLMVARSGDAAKVADFLYGLGLARFAPGGDVRSSHGDD